MLMEVKNTLKFIIKSTMCNIKCAMEYKKSFILQSILMMINNLFYVIFWQVVFNANQNQVNVELKNVLIIISISCIAWGITNFFFGGIRELHKYVISGELDTYLLQPKSMFFNIATSKSELAAFGDLVFGVIIGIISVPNIIGFFQVILFSITGAVIYSLVMFTIRLFSVWIGDMENILELYDFNLLIKLSQYPSEIFSKVVKIIIFTIVPAMYVVHLPVQIIGAFNIKVFALIIGAIIVYAVIAYLLWKIAIKNYESGNNISMKM